MKLTVELLSEIKGIQVTDSENILSEFNDVDIDNVCLVNNNVVFTIVKNSNSFDNSMFGGDKLCVEFEDNDVYDITDYKETFSLDDLNKMESDNDDKDSYVYSDDEMIKYDTTSESWPSEPEKCAYLAETGDKLDLDCDSSYDCGFSYYQGKNGALVIERESDGTEDPKKSGWYLTSSFEEFEEMYL